MAAPTTVKAVAHGHVLVRWNLTTADNEGDFISLPDYRVESVHVHGTFGTGTVALKGSNEGTQATENDLPDRSETALSFMAAGVKGCGVSMNHVRPTISGSTGANVNVDVLFVHINNG